MTAHEMVAKARTLPKVSGAALKLVGLLNGSGDNHRESVELIKSDSFLTAKLLRVCNSAAIGLAEPVSSVDQAVLLLGRQQVLSLVLSIAVGGAMSGKPSGSAGGDKGLWRHSFMAAAAAEAAVNLSLFSGVEASAAFTAGLLHDMGKLIMSQVVDAKAQDAIRRVIAEGSGEGVAAERKILGTDHAEVGACLLHVWRLPDWIVEAVANHHEPVLEPAPKLSTLAYLANRIAHFAEVEPGSATSLSKTDERVAQILKLNAGHREDLVVVARRSAEKAEDLLGMV